MISERIYPLFSRKLEEQNEIEILKAIDKDYVLDTKIKYRVILSFDDITKRDNFISTHPDLKILKQFELIPSISLDLTREQIQEYSNEELIKTIEEDQKLYLSLLDVIEKIGLNQYRLSKNAQTGYNIRVGIVDNGINEDFDTFAGVDVVHYSLNSLDIRKKKSEITHGTLMANIIVNQYLDDNNNIIGIAPDSKIIDFDISNDKEEYFFSDILGIFDLIIKNKIIVDVLLNSFTTLHPSDGKDILSLACILLVDNGIVIVCPAGNFGPENFTIGSPGAAEKVITFGSYTKKGKISYFSGRGPTLDERIKPDFCLPGSKIEIPLSEENRIVLSGTSVSAAIGAGIIAIIKELDLTMSYIRVFATLKRASKSLNYENISQGSGTIYVPELFKEIDFKKIALKTVKGVKLKREKGKLEKSKVEKKETKTKKEKEEKPLSYNYMLLKSFSVSLQFITLLILMFYIFYYLEIIITFFTRIFTGGS
jgi:serine protease AprX